MPMYTYICSKCGHTEELIGIHYEKRDKRGHCQCGGKMKRAGVESFAIGAPAYQCKAIFSDGSHVPGHFDKSAKRNRKKKGVKKHATK